MRKRLAFEQLEDRRMLATITVTGTGDTINAFDGVVTLREAIVEANDNSTPDEVDNIRFAGNALNATINLQSALPTITEPVSIEVNPFFTTNPDTVTLNWTGSSGGFVSALNFSITTNSLPFASFQEVNGLKITNFTGHGIDVQDLFDDTFFVVELSEIDNNGGNGINIDLPSNQDIEEWKISDNIITNNTVGIRVNNVEFTKFSISGNLIGTDGASTTDGNLSHGIYLSDVSASSIDSSSGILLNTISGNGSHGIFLEDTFFISGDIVFNEIGVDETETSAIPNGGDGIRLLRSRTEIGSNDIGSNVGNGITLDDSDLVVINNNRIGRTLGAFGQDFGNGGSGIAITNGSGRALVDSNFLWFNDGDGVEISVFTTNRNQITDNDFRGNSGIPIDLLGVNGSNPNDPDDADSFGPNDLMNYPVIQTGSIALSGSTWTVPFAFDVDIAGDYRFEFYGYDAATDDYDFIKSENVLGVTVGALDFLGSATFTNVSELSAGDRLSVLAIRTSTSSSGNTSELSLPTSPIVNNDTTPPQVLNVIISGSQSVHDPFLMDTVDGSGSQLATVPVGGADTISIVFSKDVNVAANSLQVIGLTTATMPQLVLEPGAFSYDNVTNTATWKMEGWALADQYLLSLSDTITDVEENNLDGEWTNPASINTVNSLVSTFPSGDGEAGGQFDFVITLLPGDANLDGFVDGPADGVVHGEDYLIVWENWKATGSLFEDGDFSGNGRVSGTDLLLLNALVGTNLQNISILADFDGDFDVDATDLNWINDNIGMTGASLADGDLNGDGLVTIADFDIAFAQWGLGISVAS